jgi:hypothetical protein
LQLNLITAKTMDVMDAIDNSYKYERAMKTLNDCYSARIFRVSNGVYLAAFLTADQEFEFQILENSESSSILPCVFMSKNDDYYYYNFIKRVISLFSILKTPLSISEEALEAIDIWHTFRESNPVLSGYLKTVLFSLERLSICVSLSLAQENDDRSVSLL